MPAINGVHCREEQQPPRAARATQSPYHHATSIRAPNLNDEPDADRDREHVRKRPTTGVVRKRADLRAVSTGEASAPQEALIVHYGLRINEWLSRSNV